MALTLEELPHDPWQKNHIYKCIIEKMQYALEGPDGRLAMQHLNLRNAIIRGSCCQLLIDDEAALCLVRPVADIDMLITAGPEASGKTLDCLDSWIHYMNDTLREEGVSFTLHEQKALPLLGWNRSLITIELSDEFCAKEGISPKPTPGDLHIDLEVKLQKRQELSVGNTGAFIQTAPLHEQLADKVLALQNPQRHHKYFHDNITRGRAKDMVDIYQLYQLACEAYGEKEAVTCMQSVFDGNKGRGKQWDQLIKVIANLKSGFIYGDAEFLNSPTFHTQFTQELSNMQQEGMLRLNQAIPPEAILKCCSTLVEAMHHPLLRYAAQIKQSIQGRE